jgi:hypothetical protein
MKRNCLPSRLANLFFRPIRLANAAGRLRGKTSRRPALQGSAADRAAVVLRDYDAG